MNNSLVGSYHGGQTIQSNWPKKNKTSQCQSNPKSRVYNKRQHPRDQNRHLEKDHQQNAKYQWSVLPTARLNRFTFFLPWIHRTTCCIVIVVVNGLPISTADVAKLVPASTCNVIAALVFLYYHLAPLTSFVLQIFYQNVSLKLIAVPPMRFHQTFSAKSVTTSSTNHLIATLLLFSNNPLAFLPWTHLAGRIVKSGIESMQFSILLLNIQGQFFEEFPLGVNQNITFCVGTGDLLELIYHVNCVLVHAGLTETLLVLAICYKELGCLLTLLHTYLALKLVSHSSLERSHH